MPLSPERPPKRPRKVFRACEQCTTAKVRCAEVEAGGCSRCRRRKETCSLAGISVAPDLVEPPALTRRQTTASDFDIRILDEPIASLEARRQQNRTAAAHRADFGPLPDLTSTVGTHSQPLLTIQPRGPDIRAFSKAISQSPHKHYFGESSLTVVDAESYPDVVGRGLLTPREMDMAFQMFKHRFCRIFPYPPYLAVSSPTPDHAFVRSAVLAFVPEYAPVNFNNLVDESVLHAMTGAFTHDVMLALFILSLAPMHSSSADHVPISATRLTGLAYQMGQSLGCDARAEGRRRRSGGDLPAGGALLWEAVKQQHVLMSLLSTQQTAFPFMRFSEVSLDDVEFWDKGPLEDDNASVPTWRYLRVQAAMLDQYISFAAQVSTLELPMIGPISGLPEQDSAGVMRELLRSWQSHELDFQWPDQPESNLPQPITFAKQALRFALSLRLTMALVMFYPTSKRDPGEMSPLQQAGVLVVRTGCRLIASYLSIANSSPSGIPSDHIPAFIITVVIAALSLIRRTVVVLLKAGKDPEQALGISLVELKAAEDSVATIPGLPRRILREMWDSLDEDKEARMLDGEVDWSLIEDFYRSLRENGLVE